MRNSILFRSKVSREGGGGGGGGRITISLYSVKFFMLRSTQSKNNCLSGNANSLKKNVSGRGGGGWGGKMAHHHNSCILK